MITTGWLRKQNLAWPDVDASIKQRKRPRNPIHFTTKEGLIKYCPRNFSDACLSAIHTDQFGEEYYLKDLLFLCPLGLSSGPYAHWLATSCTQSMFSTFLHYFSDLAAECASASIEILCTEETKLAREKLNQDGGFAITHNMVIKFDDSSKATIDKLKQLLIDLHRILAFANGAWVGIHLVKGFNNCGELNYLSLTDSLCTRHKGRFGWFDAHHGHVLALVGPKLVEAFDNSKSSDTFDRALYWYVRANNSAGVGIDAGIILATTALELLAKFVKQKNKLKIESTGEQKPPSLGDKIRAAALHLEIPTLTADNICPQFWAIKNDGQWSDIPEAIAKYRNDLVHPKAKIKSDNQHALTLEMWQLSVWYLELFMLRLIGYQDVYSNRLTAKWLGEVEHVPWAGSKSS